MSRVQGADHDGFRGVSAPPIVAPGWKHHHYVDRPDDLRALAANLAAARTIAIDAEFVQTRGPRRPTDLAHRLALLQFTSDDDHTHSTVVDTLRLPDLSPLRAALEAPDILKLFHGISADARMLATRGLEARYTLDLEAVSRSIFGPRESGLQAMLLRACNIRLDKSLQRADWARRPLTPAMVAYAARDAEMTLVLYSWLAANYAWAVALHLQPADEPPPDVAPWLLPYVDGTRTRPVETAVAEAGIADNLLAQEQALREALARVRHPGHRARVMRIASDLGLTGLAPDLHAYLPALASEERAGAIRALGRLRVPGSAALVRPLLGDPVHEVRQAAQLALDQLEGRAALGPEMRPEMRPERRHGGIWTIGGDAAGDPADPNDWRAALRARFGIAASGMKSADERTDADAETDAEAETDADAD
ncbi:MAG: hypothetical protein IVW57_00545 [Ktedonobacterales bacterium]|nr:hypothetical protein [Ktedonobacterales bacterium]